MKKYTLTEYCTLNNQPELLEEWDYEKNGEITPDNSYPYSKNKAFWRCKEGHQWSTAIYCRAIKKAGCPFCDGKKVQPGNNDLETLRPEIAAQWHLTKNGSLRSNMVTVGSNRLVWWQCDKGHEWQSKVKSRTYGTGCPYCAGRLVIRGETDIETLYPKLAKQWHPTKNGDLKPYMVSSGNRKYVWWQDEFGHEWKAQISTRTYQDTGCPYCSGKKVLVGFNDLVSQDPKIAAQWHPTLNGTKTPEMYTSGSNEKVWWQCEKGHEWRASISSRTRGNNCPYCSDRKLLPGFNDLQTKFPHIAAEWDSEKNGITPDKVKSSPKKAWWRCPEGHEYYSQISARVYQNIGCPVCDNKTIIEGVNDLATLNPELAKEWHPTKNGDLKPTMVSIASQKKVWWQDKYGHEWSTEIGERSYYGTGCPYCSGHRVLVGFNDFASKQPKIAAQWHPVLNGDKTPSMFTCGSNYKAWWQCSEGHVWRASIGRRCHEFSGCPECAGNVGEKTLLKYKKLMKEQMLKLNSDSRKDK